MSATDKGAGNRVCICTDLWTDIIGGVPVGIFVWVRDMGDDPMHQEGAGRIPLQGELQADGEATSAR